MKKPSLQAYGLGASAFAFTGEAPGYPVFRPSADTFDAGTFYSGDASCFCPGTLIATPSGAVLVEALAAGDLVLAADGRAMKLRWAGTSRVSTKHGDMLRCLPIRIKAGALAEGLPARDLLVSSDHALFINGVLVQAGGLVNDRSILREGNMPEQFTYHHLELDSHELILAEGAPVESFLEQVGAEWPGREAPGEMIPPLSYPRARSARQVPMAVRRQISARMDEAGFKA